VKTKVSRNGICGTDIHEYYDGPVLIPKTEPHPLTGRTLPVVIGHEFSGTVVEMGHDVADIKEGDNVAIEPVIRCGMCRPCRSGFYNVCNCVGFQGLSSDGGMAEYAVVPSLQWPSNRQLLRDWLRYDSQLFVVRLRNRPIDQPCLKLHRRQRSRQMVALDEIATQLMKAH
jgi:threonine dehydrogenase-like Zn-dependent dehydrogenase